MGSFRVEPFGLNGLWILHIFNTLGTDAEFSNTWKRPNPRPNSKLTLLIFYFRTKLYILTAKDWNVDSAGKSGLVRMESETCLNEVLTFVMLNRGVVKINIDFQIYNVAQIPWNSLQHSEIYGPEPVGPRTKLSCQVWTNSDKTVRRSLLAMIEFPVLFIPLG